MTGTAAPHRSHKPAQGAAQRLPAAQSAGSHWAAQAIDRSPAMVAQRQRIASGFGAAGVVQRVITFTKEAISPTPEEVFDRVKGGKDGLAYIAAHGADGLLAYIKLQDKKTFASMSAFLRQLKAAAKGGGGDDSKTGFIAAGRSMVGHSDLVDAMLGGDSRFADEMYYKIALVSKLPDSGGYVGAFVGRLAQLGVAFAKRMPVDWAGVKSTLGLLLVAWGQQPDYYINGPGQDSLFGNGEQGVVLAIKGLNAELDALLSVDPRELAKGEDVFSGSTYTDTSVREMTKDVDVSYIDGDGVLHLIEAAKDMNTLHNKVVGKADQKAIYAYLAHQSREIEHEPVGGLTPEQAERNSVTDVQWWYTVPPETLNLDTSRKPIAEIVRALVAARAGLRSGGKRFTPSQLAGLL